VNLLTETSSSNPKFISLAALNQATMNKTLGIRHEDKYVMERRVAITPEHAKKFIENNGLEILVTTSPKRVFKDDEFSSVGAKIVDSVADNAPVVFGVKEMPIDFFRKGGTYVFFSHVIKGQPYNMPMLQKMIDLKCTLIDYEKVADEQGRRLIFFGRYAGLAGMINSLWSFGQRLKEQGIANPFETLRQAHTYDSLMEAKKDISQVGMSIAKDGLPAEISPLTIGFTGYGNVSNGAQEIAALLPIKEVSPAELLQLQNEIGLPHNVVYKTVFYEKDLSKPKDPAMKFELQDYYAHPEKYEDQFQKYIPHLSILMNCMYWDERYPRIVTKDFLEELYSSGEPRLKVIGDVTCDPDGSIECTHKGTEIEDPVFVYDPFNREPAMGFKGKGILVMAVDILPSELPREASETFSHALLNYVVPITETNYDVPFEELDLPAPIKRAVILLNGELTPDFKYINQYL
jgi:alpha-aminoadipic semialdehyde synthase